MLYMKGKINAVSLKEPEGKKPFYNVQFSQENENGSIFTDWCKIYPVKGLSISDAGKKLNIGDELEIQVKINAWAKEKFQVIGFIK